MFKANDAPKVSSGSLHDGFRMSAVTAPDNIALVIEGKEYSYAKLDLLARTWASALSSMQRPPKRVLIVADRTLTAYVGQLAALYIGASFVPLNVHAPIERSKSILSQACPGAIIADANAVEYLEQILASRHSSVDMILFPEAQADTRSIAGVPTYSGVLADVAPISGPEGLADDDEAYLLFTSGTTGAPKGVPISHRNVTSFIRTNQARYGFRSSDRFTQLFDSTFDLSVFDIYMAWNAGAAVCPLKPLEILSPYRAVARLGITVWFSVPSVAALLIRQNTLETGSMPGLRVSMFCGEALPAAVAEKWQAAAPFSIVENLYGPTELTIACSSYRWRGVDSERECVNGLVPIGELFPGLEYITIDEDLRPTDPSVGGELCVRGEQRFSGYLSKSSRDPFIAGYDVPYSHDALYYRTGDRVRQLTAGPLVYLGRSDDQVQVAGHRVELLEVEGALASIPGVQQAVVLPLSSDGSIVTGLIGCITGTDLSSSQLQRQAREALPSYMVPREFIFLEEFPLSANGKIDRKELKRRITEAGVFA